MPVAPGGPFPQTASNRDFDTLAREIGDHDGGGNDPVVRQIAMASLRDTVREFNDVPWIFNRMSFDITFADTADGALAEFDLNSNWRSPLRAVFVDTLGNEVQPLRWAPAEEKFYFASDESTVANRPYFYTAYNEHERGKIRYYPRLKGPYQYPKMRHYYHRRIVPPVGEAGKLNVPEEVENAIFKRAVANFLAKRLGFASAAAKAARDEARELRFNIEREHRDWGEIY